MATVRAYSNGVTVHVGGTGSHTRAKRGRVVGWSAAAVRRHTRWLYGVHVPDLDGDGWALTLTLRVCPTSAEEWTDLRRAWVRKVREDLGAVRWHWVVEWQRRGVPHIHAAVYLPPGVSGWEAVAAWLAVAERFEAGWGSQTAKPIDGPEGWLKYLSKHAARGVAHYQRQGMPEGWSSTGRLWGYGGRWPVLEPVEVGVDLAEFWRFRRLVRAWRVADARAAGYRGEGWGRLTYARRMLRDPDRARSAYRGVSEWVPEAMALRLLDVVKGGPVVGEDGGPWGP